MPVTVAVVDDDVRFLNAVGLVLEVHGWCVRTYATGESSLADFAHHKPDCVILDPHLLGISGAEIARLIANDDTPVPIVGLTARPTSPMATEVSNAGARVMLTKPVRAEVLIGQVRVAIREA